MPETRQTTPSGLDGSEDIFAKASGATCPWTFDRGARCAGPSFSAATPDGFAEVRDCGRPFALVPDDRAELDDPLDEADALLYVASGSAMDERAIESQRLRSLPELQLHAKRHALYGASAGMVEVRGDAVVGGIGCDVLVTHNVNAYTGASEFYLLPLDAGTVDFLRITAYWGFKDAYSAEELASAALALAATVELSEPVRLELPRQVEALKSPNADDAQFVRTGNAVAHALTLARAEAGEADGMKWANLQEDPTMEGIFEAFARSFMRFNEDVCCPYITRFVDALEAQKAAGAGERELSEMRDTVDNLMEVLLPARFSSDNEELEEGVNATGLIGMPDAAAALRGRMGSLLR